MTDVSRRRFLQASAAALSTGLAGCAPDQEPGHTQVDRQNGPETANTAPIATEPPELADEARQPALSSTPNICLIMMDTLRADKLGCYGHPANPSPMLDHYARQGVRFERAISQCSWTRPSVGSFLTSLFPRTLGLFKEQGEILHERYDTLPKILQRNGYRTLGITANPNINSRYNFHLGFDEYVDSAVLFGWMKEQGEEAKVRGRGATLPSANNMFRQMLKLLQKPSKKPTYIQINAMEIHEWYISRTMIRPQYRKMYLDSGEKYPKYLQSIRQLTDDIGVFIEKVKALPGFRDTLFILMSDHGEGLDSHPVVRNSLYHGWLLYESNVVVPWILYRDGWTPAVTAVEQPVRLLELLPTVLDLAGIPVPENIEGKSLAPILRGETETVPLPRFLITETHWRTADKIAAYDSDWKCFHNRTRMPTGIPERELQAAGPNENGIRTDRFKQHSDVGTEMLAYLSAWEAAHPLAPVTAPATELSAEEQEQLEAIGYLGGDDDAAGPAPEPEMQPETPNSAPAPARPALGL